MVTSFFLWIIYGFVYILTSPLRLLDDVTISDNLSTAFKTGAEYLANLNEFMPVSTIVSIFGIILGVELLIASYKIIMWIIRRIPTQS